MKNERQAIKCVIVGDSAVGKTGLLISYITRKLPEHPSVFNDIYTVNVTVDGVPISLGLWDTSGKTTFDKVRPQAYPKTDVVLICFSLISLESLENVGTKWYPEVCKHCPDIPIILVGTKLDLREQEVVQVAENSFPKITRSRVLQTMNQTGLMKYIECSALTRKGVKNVIDDAIRDALKHKKNKDGKESDESQKKRKKKFCFFF